MYMRYNLALQIVIFTLFLFSCKKSHTPDPVIPEPAGPKVLLKDIIIPGIPSPYYHFEYSADSTVSKADFSSGLAIYDVLYKGGKISEMRDEIIVNRDTLRYAYDNAGKVTTIAFIDDDDGSIYRHAVFSYNGNQVKEIAWDHKAGTGFAIDRTLTFTYFPDGNLKTISEHRLPVGGSPEENNTREFAQYDDGINVDDFDLAHDGINDHLFLFQGFRLQKNNPKKETFTGGTISYTVDYIYTYNNDHTPSLKTGTLTYTAGPDAGKTFPVSTNYTYY